MLGAAWVMDPALFTVTGANITSAADAGGGSVLLTAAAGKEPVLVTNGPFTGKPALRTSNGLTKLFSPTGGVTGAQPWHQIAIFERIGPAPASGFGTFALMGTPGPAGANNVGLGAITSNLVAGGNGSSGTIVVSAAVPYVDSTPHIVEAKYDGTNLYLYFDGKLSGGPIAKTYAISTADIGFGNWYNLPGNAAYYGLDARVHSMAFGSNKNFAQPDVNAFLRYELARLAGPTGKPRALVLFGDSFTEGTAVGSKPLDASIRLAQVAPNIVFPSNQGISGQRPDQIVARIPAYTGIATHIGIWAGVNLTLTPVTPAVDAVAAYAQISNGVASAHAMECKAVVGTIPQWGTSTVGSYINDFRLALNTLILANTAGADAIADIDVYMGAFTPSNFCADMTHPSATALDTIIGPAWYAAYVSC
jgi:hypothetical protein